MELLALKCDISSSESADYIFVSFKGVGKPIGIFILIAFLVATFGNNDLSVYPDIKLSLLL